MWHIYIYNVILFGHKNKWNTDTLYNVDEPWRHPKWKKLVTEGHILYNFIYMQCPEEANP